MIGSTGEVGFEVTTLPCWGVDGWSGAVAVGVGGWVANAIANAILFDAVGP